MSTLEYLTVFFNTALIIICMSISVVIIVDYFRKTARQNGEDLEKCQFKNVSLSMQLKAATEQLENVRAENAELDANKRLLSTRNFELNNEVEELKLKLKAYENRE